MGSFMDVPCSSGSQKENKNARSVRNKKIHFVGGIQNYSVLKKVIHIEPVAFKRFIKPNLITYEQVDLH
jgi:hypothetical protein